MVGVDEKNGPFTGSTNVRFLEVQPLTKARGAVLKTHVVYLILGVSKNSGTPKWMVYSKKNPMKMDDLGVPLYLETHRG